MISSHWLHYKSELKNMLVKFEKKKKLLVNLDFGIKVQGKNSGQTLLDSMLISFSGKYSFKLT